MTMHTKDFLAAELARAGLHDMAARAAGGYYHDYLSPLEAPSMQLADDLAAAGTRPALALRQRHLRGEFDASQTEADEWARTLEGGDARRTAGDAFRTAGDGGLETANDP